MTRTSTTARRGAPRRRAPEPQVFRNPSGRRWRRIRAAGLLLLAVLVAAAVIAVPRVLAPPALDGAPVPDGPSAATVGRPPVVGEGPLVRVVQVLREGGTTYGQDPFTGLVTTALDPADAAEVAGAEFALQRYGYSESASRTVTLTFDDGPHPEYTPELLDLLSARGVPAAFFVTGEQIAEHPEIVRRMTREGFPVGNHSLTHVDVNATTEFRQRLEVVITDRILRAQTGRYASYFRLPYEADDVEGMRDDVPGILRAQQLGYAVVSHDFDPQDWAHGPGEADEIPMPPLGEQDNITVLLHDAGGADRTATLEYVDALITEARDAGYTFTALPQVLPELGERAGPTEPTVWDALTLRVATALLVLPGTLLHGLFVFALVTMVGFGLLNTLLALIRARRVRRRTSTARPPVAVLIAAFNEERVIGRTVECALASGYPVREVVVVDDGSTDRTAAVVRALAARDPRVRLLRQANAGKWAALNRGFAAVDAEIVVTLDADTVIVPDTVEHLVAAFTSADTGAVAGVVKVGNLRRNLLTRWQALEYLTQIGVERGAAALLGAVMVVPGACSAWRRSAVLQAGGYSSATLAEDCDLTLALHRHGWRVGQADGAVAWTEAPETLDALLNQRARWMFGTLQALWRHRSMILRPRFGWLGMLVLPMAVVTVVLPLLFTPVVVLAVVALLADGAALQVLLYLGVFAAVYGVVAAVAVRLLHERAVHLLMVPVYRLIYEPLRAYLLYASVGTAIRGARMGWKKGGRTAHLDDAGPGTPGRVAPTEGSRLIGTPVGVAS